MILIVCLILYFHDDIAIPLLKLILKVISRRSSIEVIPILNALNDQRSFNLNSMFLCSYD